MDLVNFIFLDKLLKLSVRTGLLQSSVSILYKLFLKLHFCSVHFVQVCAGGWPPGNAAARCLLVVWSGWLGTAARSAINPWAPPAELRG